MRLKTIYKRLIIYFISIVLVFKFIEQFNNKIDKNKRFSNLHHYSNEEDISARKIGYCAPMPGAEESCLYRENSFGTNYLDGLVFQCPCKSGLECVKNPNGYYIVPIGYQGTCKSN